ncbi:MAG: hypothetical protein MJZ16_13880, partial [Bacteroidales bacterium]|nr:hypothetical protein [Bacteroidales bacterium]
MNKSTKLLSILFAASSLLAVSCDKNNDAMNEDLEGDALISFVAQKPSIEADTKTAWNSDRNVVTWKVGDRLKVACLRDGEFWQNKSADATSDAPAKIYTSKGLEEDCDVASFMMNQSSIFTWTAPGSYEFYSVYPSNLFSSADFPNAPKAKVTLSPSQHMSSTSFDYDADILLGKSKEAITEVVTEFTVIPMVFKRMVALSQITFKGLKDAEDDEIVKSVTLQAQDDAKLTGPVTIDILDGTIDGSAASNKVTLKSSSGIALDQNSSITLWFSTLEFTATKLDVTVETDVATYTRSIDLSANAKTFSRDKRNILTINMSGASREEKLTDQPTEVVFGTLGYESWGESVSFSGNSKNQVIQTKDNVQITYTRNGSSLYANQNAIRFYRDNTIKIDAPKGYVITSIVWDGSGFKGDVKTNVVTCSSSTSALSWAGESASVIFTRPAGVSGYETLSGVTVTLKKDETTTDPDTPAVSSAIVTTGEVEEVTSSTAVLPGYYTNASALPTEVRFEYGTSSDALNSTAYYNDGGLEYPEGSFSVTISSLAPGTTYYYRAVVQVGDTDFFGAVRSFSTETVQGVVPKGWLELPAPKSAANLYQGHFGLGKSRNYSYLYDMSTYTALWS